MSDLNSKQLSTLRKKVLSVKENNNGNDIKKIINEYDKRRRGFDVRSFIDSRINAMPTVPPKNLAVYILLDMILIKNSIDKILNEMGYNFSRHIDLSDYKKMHRKTKNRYKNELKGWGRRDEVKPINNPEGRRKDLVRSIVWNTVKVHYSENLQEEKNFDKLIKLVDRRLHIVELMRYVVSIGPSGSRDWKFKIGANSQPKWTDGHILRLFEYPRIKNTSKSRKAIGEWLDNVNMLARDKEKKQWGASKNLNGVYEFEDIKKGSKKLTRGRGNGPIGKPSNSASVYWKTDKSKGYKWLLSPDGLKNPVKAIDSLFEPSLAHGDYTQKFTHQNPDKGWKNWWERNHFYCDQVIHTLHLRSLLLVLRKYSNPSTILTDLIKKEGNKYIQIYYPWAVESFSINQSGFDSLKNIIDADILNLKEFENLKNRKFSKIEFFRNAVYNILNKKNKYEKDYINRISSEMSKKLIQTGGYLGNDSPYDPYFENTSIPIKELQIGDGIVIQNHPVYPNLTSEPWQNENAVVVDLKRPQKSRDRTIKDIWVQGHGTRAQPLPELLKQLFKHVNKHLDGARSLIEKKIATGKRELSYGGINKNLVVLPNENNIKENWKLGWKIHKNKPSLRVWPGSGITVLERGAYYVYLFPLWHRTKKGRFQKVIVDDKMMGGAYEYFDMGQKISVVRPKII